MTVLEGCDYSETPPGSAALKAAGKHFACRYLTTDSRGLTAAEIADFKAGGIALVLIYETDGLGFRSGQVTGNLDAIAAQGHVFRLGLPLSSPVYFTVDDQFNPLADGPGLTGYLQATKRVLGGGKRNGLYGPEAAVQFAAEHGLADYLWQTSGWSGIPTVWFPGNNLEQYAYGVMINGTSCDATRALTADYGQVGGATAPAVVYPAGLDAGIAKRAFGSFKASNGVTVSYTEGEELSALWLASGSYGRIVDVGIYKDSPTITRLTWQFSDGQMYGRANATAPIVKI